MASARMHDLVPHATTLPDPAPGKSWAIFEVEGSAQELDGSLRVIPAFVAAVGPIGISVAHAELVGRIAAGIARATHPSSPGGTRITPAEIGREVLVLVL